MPRQKSHTAKKQNTKKKSLKFFLLNHPLSRSTIRDFFIPHAGNNHKPTSLHPKRVIFHISVALVTKAIVMLFVLNYPLTAWMSPEVSAVEGKKIITLTNSLRSGLALNNLAESQKLNLVAYKKVQDMFINQYFAHRSPAGLGLEYWAGQGGYNGYAVIGENLAVGFNNANEVMNAWERSPTHYNNLVDKNYRDIGVSIVGGQYKDKDTIFIAQYFGSTQLASVTPPPAPVKTIEKVVVEIPQTVLSDKTATPPVIPKEAVKPPVRPITPIKSVVKPITPATPVAPPKLATTTKTVAVAPKPSIIISQPVGKPAEKVVQVKVDLPEETTTAVVEIFDHKIALSLGANGQWQGQDVIVTEDDQSSVVPPAITVSNSSGESIRSDISAENIAPESGSVLGQYSLYRHYPNGWLNTIFSVSSWYYKIILVFAVIALALNIFIARHKQHPHLIASGVGLALSMVFLIIF